MCRLQVCHGVIPFAKQLVHESQIKTDSGSRSHQGRRGFPEKPFENLLGLTDPFRKCQMRVFGVLRRCLFPAAVEQDERQLLQQRTRIFVVDQSRSCVALCRRKVTGLVRAPAQCARCFDSRPDMFGHACFNGCERLFHWRIADACGVAQVGIEKVGTDAGRQIEGALRIPQHGVTDGGQAQCLFVVGLIDLAVDEILGSGGVFFLRVVRDQSGYSNAVSAECPAARGPHPDGPAV
jgi:hypothetical protein